VSVLGCEVEGVVSGFKKCYIHVYDILETYWSGPKIRCIQCTCIYICTGVSGNICRASRPKSKSKSKLPRKPMHAYIRVVERDKRDEGEKYNLKYVRIMRYKCYG